MKIWIKETLSFLKARGVITENILLLKYKMQEITAALSGKMPLCCYLLIPSENRRYAKRCLLLSFETLRWSGIKFLIGNFTGVPIMDFILNWESEIVNQSGLQANSSENWCFSTKNESSLEKKQFHRKNFFSNKSKSSKKRRVYRTKVSIQNSAVKYYNELHLMSHNKDLKMLILAAPFLLLTKVIL